MITDHQMDALNNARGIFGLPMAILIRNKKTPGIFLLSFNFSFLYQILCGDDLFLCELY